MMNLIRQAVARGWCTDRNSHKEMDSDLAEDIAASVNEALFGQNGVSKTAEMTVGDLLEAAAIIAIRREGSKVGYMGDVSGAPFGPSDR